MLSIALLTQFVALKNFFSNYNDEVDFQFILYHFKNLKFSEKK